MANHRQKPESNSPSVHDEEENWSKVVLVDDNDESIGEADKLIAHQKGLLHRAFSVFLFNSEGKMLLQQRAEGKYHGAGLWTNACCSHPQDGEDIKESATRRLLYEMGITCDISKVFAFTYHTEVENGLIEHEYDHVFLGISDKQPQPNPLEVKDYKWITTTELLNEIETSPKKYTYWFRMAMPIILNALHLHHNKNKI